MDKEKIFKFIYQMAFRDATMRKAFPHDEDETDDAYWKRKNDAYNVAMPIAKKYVDDLLDGKDAIKLESYMIDICEKTKEYGFTFGNAQKLINMLAKYMYLICYQDEEKRQLFKNCDCPMDGGMIEVVRKENKNCSIPRDFPWSTMDYEGEIPKEYTAFQEAIKNMCKDDIYAIEYDFEKWQQ